MKEFIDKLREILPEEQIRTMEPMAAHTTFRVGGPADYFTEPGDEETLAQVQALCRREGMASYILGNGSNLLVSDSGYRGMMILLGKAWSGITVDGSRICAGAGAMLSAVSRQAWKAGLTGLEFASGIPGTVGGAVVMNAGAYGSEMSAVLKSARVMTAEGEVLTIPAGELSLGYRTSCIPAKGYTVLEAEFALEPGDPAAIGSRMEELAAQRRQKQPLEYPSAGSTFKRPEGYFAGKLIQDAGLRGFRVGGAQVSEKHCGFVINKGGASASDIMQLCCQVQQKVRDQFGVELELEVKVLGDFGFGG